MSVVPSARGSGMGARRRRSSGCPRRRTAGLVVLAGKAWPCPQAPPAPPSTGVGVQVHECARLLREPVGRWVASVAAPPSRRDLSLPRLHPRPSRSGRTQQGDGAGDGGAARRLSGAARPGRPVTLWAPHCTSAPAGRRRRWRSSRSRCWPPPSASSRLRQPRWRSHPRRSPSRTSVAALRVEVGRSHRAADGVRHAPRVARALHDGEVPRSTSRSSKRRSPDDGLGFQVPGRRCTGADGAGQADEGGVAVAALLDHRGRSTACTATTRRPCGPRPRDHADRRRR